MLKSRVIYLGYVIGAVIIASVTGGEVPYFLVYIALIFPIFARLYIHLVYQFIDYYQVLSEKKVMRDDVKPYHVVLMNKGIFSFSHVKLHFYDQLSKVVSQDLFDNQLILPGEEIKVEGHIVFNYRGQYEVGICEIEVSDFFYLFRVKKRMEWPLSVTVLPKVIPLERLSFLPHMLGIKMTEFAQQAESPFRKGDSLENELRNYEKGDPKKAINWKVSAKQRKMMSRKNSSDIQGELCILMDLEPVKAKKVLSVVIEDRIIETTLAVANYMKKQGISVRVSYYLEKLITYDLREKNGFKLFYEACTTLVFEGDRMAVCIKKQLMRDRQPESCLVIIHNLSWELTNILCQSSMQYRWMLIYIEKVNEKMDQAMKNQLILHNIMIYPIKYTDCLKEKLEGSEGNETA